MESNIIPVPVSLFDDMLKNLGLCRIRMELELLGLQDRIAREEHSSFWVACANHRIKAIVLLSQDIARIQQQFNKG